MDKHALAEYIYKLKITSIVLVFLFLFGSFGFMLVEGYTFSEGLYMTVITFTTIGYGETRELHTLGRYYNIGLIFVGVSILGYFLSLLTQILIAKELGDLVGRRAMQRQIEQLKDHFIICGYGPVGNGIAMELTFARVPFVIIENDEDTFNKIVQDEFLCMHGNPQHEEILLKAGLDRAKGLVAVSKSDDENVFITLSARALYANVNILASADDEHVEPKLIQAGANRVFSANRDIGRQIAMSVLKPTVLEFIDGLIGKRSMEFYVTELKINAASPLIGKTPDSLDVLKEYKVSIVGLHKDGGKGKSVFHDVGEAEIQENDLILVAGFEGHVNNFTEKYSDETDDEYS